MHARARPAAPSPTSTPGTWIEANVEIEDGRIVYVGPREPPRRRRRSTSRGKVVVPGLHRAAHAPVVPVLAGVACSRSAVPDGTTTLVYDNLFFFLAHGVDGLRAIVDAMNQAPAHVTLGRAARAAVGLPRRGASASRPRSSRRCWPGPRSWPAARSRTGSTVAAATRASAAGIAAAKAARQARRGPQRGRVLRPARRALRRRHLRRPRGDHGRGGAQPAAAGHVDDAAPVLAAPGPRADAARPGAGRRTPRGG